LFELKWVKRTPHVSDAVSILLQNGLQDPLTNSIKKDNEGNMPFTRPPVVMVSIASNPIVCAVCARGFCPKTQKEVVGLKLYSRIEGK
jgi:hypothetical protein